MTRRLPLLLILLCLLLLTPGALSAQDNALPRWAGVYFSAPSGSSDPATYVDGPDTVLAAALDAARNTIDVAAFEMNSAAIVQALLDAHGRGVQVRLVVDDEHGLDVELYEEYLAADEDEREDLEDEFEEPLDDTLLDQLYDAGIPMVDDNRSALMHNKFVIIDSREVWTGSMNMTVNGSYRNNNNLVSIRSTRLAADYQAEFDEMFLDRQFGPRSPANTPAPRLEINGTPVEVYFAPEDGVTHRLEEIVSGAQESIQFMAFSFTLESLGEAMVARTADGVRLEGVFETTGSETAFSELTPLYCAGFDVRQDGNRFILHHKVIIIDSSTVVIGSFNFSASATRDNDENLLIIHDAAIAARYVQEFEQRFHEASVPPITCDPPRPVLAQQVCRLSADDANVRSGPGTDYITYGTLTDGDIVEVVGRDADHYWYAVDYSGLTGWVVSSAARTTSGVCESLPETPAWNCFADVYNCNSFSTCEEVQTFMTACPGDPSRLDVDGDGRACTSLCP